MTFLCENKTKYFIILTTNRIFHLYQANCLNEVLPIQLQQRNTNKVYSIFFLAQVKFFRIDLITLLLAHNNDQTHKMP